VVEASFYRPEKGGEQGGQHGLGLGFPSAFPWPQWFWKGMGVSDRAVVTLGTQWRSRVTRGAAERQGRMR
jgi:hypothetical protein